MRGLRRWRKEDGIFSLQINHFLLFDNSRKFETYDGERCALIVWNHLCWSHPFVNTISILLCNHHHGAGESSCALGKNVSRSGAFLHLWLLDTVGSWSEAVSAQELLLNHKYTFMRCTPAHESGAVEQRPQVCSGCKNSNDKTITNSVF